jgi:hypothetical protein
LFAVTARRWTASAVALSALWLAGCSSGSLSAGVHGHGSPSHVVTPRTVVLNPATGRPVPTFVILDPATGRPIRTSVVMDPATGRIESRGG